MLFRVDWSPLTPKGTASLLFENSPSSCIESAARESEAIGPIGSWAISTLSGFEVRGAYDMVDGSVSAIWRKEKLLWGSVSRAAT